MKIIGETDRPVLETIKVPEVELVPVQPKPPPTPRAATDIHPKVAAATFTGAFAVLLVWAAQRFAEITIPADVASALIVILSAIAGYWKMGN